MDGNSIVLAVERHIAAAIHQYLVPLQIRVISRCVLPASQSEIYCFINSLAILLTGYVERDSIYWQECAHEARSNACNLFDADAVLMMSEIAWLFDEMAKCQDTKGGAIPSPEQSPRLALRRAAMFTPSP
jgi:hypothetical protein